MHYSVNHYVKEVYLDRWQLEINFTRYYIKIDLKFEYLYACGLSSSSWSQRHNSVTYALSLIQLNEFEDPGRVVNESCFLNLVLNGGV